MAQFSAKFSRGNDDHNQNVYETAIIELILKMARNCRLTDGEDGSTLCEGKVLLKLTYKITPKTGNPEFGDLSRWKLRPSDTTDVSRLGAFTSTPNPNPAPLPPGAPPNWDPKIVNSNIETEVALDPMHCSGTRKALATIEEIAGGGFFSRQVITIEVRFAGCGTNPSVRMNIVEFQPGGTRPSPFIQYEDPIDTMNPRPYPSFPGVGPAAPEAREWLSPP